MQKFNYGDLIKLGFVREDDTDSVYTHETGHQPFHLTLYLCKGVSIYFNQDRTLTVYRKIKECEHTKMSVRDEAHLKELIEFFKRKPKKKRKDSYY